MKEELNELKEEQRRRKGTTEKVEEENSFANEIKQRC